jgi:5'-nucleotidase
MSTDIDRRSFVKSLMAVLAAGPMLKYASAADGTTTITILHTNDTHSQIEPIPEGSRNAGMGGVARRATYVKRVRSENPNTLLLDAGDVFQGTPYFNFYKGEVEYKAMSAIGYDVVTLGNHDFDNGVDALTSALKYANFEVVSANYNFDGSPLKAIVKPYTMRTLSGIKIGLFGMGINFEGLVLAKNHKGVTYSDPIERVAPIVERLRSQEKADLVIGISHLGYKFETEPEKVSDLKVAKAVPEIDFIVGGHTHSFMKEPEIVKHPNGRQTILFQVGKSGINVGRVDFIFSDKKLVGWRSSIFEIDGDHVSLIYHKETKL